ncbi:metal-dependent transcriptional regulator [Cumulibacter soli]|uniref:metal-dependent transcriptional regulator n=1 Tax=Cumulibacter soli TaxID=2546344 RepID=UPI0010672179|nr:metal-dependent transcriptional regulator [Cumulibacter soli]
MSNLAVTRVVEDYVTLIWKAFEWPGGTPTTTDLAAQLGVTPSTVSTTLKKLARDGFIEYEPYGDITLTEAGHALAVRVVRRHRILETYLVHALGMPWDEVHHEADHLEHAISDAVLQRMDDALGNPTHDPHGDPIPDARGVVRISHDESLADASPPATFQVTRVSDRSSDLLRYLQSLGINVGARLRVDEVNAAADAIRLSIDGARVQLSLSSAAAIRVRPL